MEDAVKGNLSLLLLLCCVAGCATDGAGDADRVFVEKPYRTGSNIPVSRTHAGDEARTASGEDLERARDGSANPGLHQLPSAPAGAH